MSVDEVRAARLADLKLREQVEDWLTDQILRGPGRSRTGRDLERLDKPCPPLLGEYHFCKAFDFRVLPADLVPGSVDDQPADTFLAYANLLSIEGETRERLEHILQRKMSKGGGA